MASGTDLMSHPSLDLCAACGIKVASKWQQSGIDVALTCVLPHGIGDRFNESPLS